MIIPIDEIAADTLDNIAREFVLREGTDYGEIEAELSDKVAQVITMLKSGDAILVYSELHDTVDIRPADSYQPDTEQ